MTPLDPESALARAEGRAISKRHYGEHPMQALTDQELHVLERLSHASEFLHPSLMETLDTLGELAAHEQGERDLKRALAERDLT